MESFGVINYATYFLGCVIIILLPGPNSLYVLSLAAQQGMRMGWAAAAGIFIGDATLILATALGAVSVLHAYPELFMVIKYAGACYLGYIGIKMILGAVQAWRENSVADFENAPVLRKTSAGSAFKKALFVSLLNPKAILFMLSFFLQFVDPQFSDSILPFLVLGATLQLCSFVYLATVIYAGHKLAESFRRRRKLSAVSGGSAGAVFLMFAANLALASL